MPTMTIEFPEHNIPERDFWFRDDKYNREDLHRFYTQALNKGYTFDDGSGDSVHLFLINDMTSQTVLYNENWYTIPSHEDHIDFLMKHQNANPIISLEDLLEVILNTLNRVPRDVGIRVNEAPEIELDDTKDNESETMFSWAYNKIRDSLPSIFRQDESSHTEVEQDTGKLDKQRKSFDSSASESTYDPMSPNFKDKGKRLK